MVPQPAYRATALDAAASTVSGVAQPGATFSEGIDPAAMTAARPFHETSQRVIDLVLGIGAAICFLPLAVIVAVILASTVGGTLLLRERRVGRHGRIFDVLRFRTMGVGMLRRGGLARLIYFARLDELPQIVNVLRGDMSVVGPRPEAPATVARLSASLRGYDLRHLVKPGLTGWTQAMGQWGARDEAARLSSDLYYVEHRSLALDLRILIRTVAVVLGGAAGRGA